MTETLGRCQYCGGALKRIIHADRKASRAVAVGCEHCDRPCERPRCPVCQKMLKTVRSIPRD